MQERRTTVRYECTGRAQYCAPADDSPLDGWLTTLTDRGLGLLVQKPYQVGERLTVSFTIPGEHETVTTTGVIRWAGQTPLKSRRYPLGIEWPPLEETSRFRLDTFFRHQADIRREASAETRSGRRSAWWKQLTIRWRTLTLFSILVICVLLASVVSLREKNVQLDQTVHQRNVAIVHLEDSGRRLRLAFDAKTTQLDQTAAQLQGALEAVEHLELQTGEFQGEMRRLTGEVERFQAAYTTLREERSALVRQIVDLERERSRMVKRLSAIPQFRPAGVSPESPPQYVQDLPE